MIKPRRVVEKREKAKKILTLCLLTILIVILSGISLYKLNIFEKIRGSSVVSPIPGIVGVKNSVQAVFSNPTDELKDNLRKAGVEYTDIYTASESAYIVKQKEGQEIYFTSTKDIKIQVATLQLILSRLTIEGKNFTRLDLRYDKPVITAQ